MLQLGAFVVVGAAVVNRDVVQSPAQSLLYEEEVSPFHAHCTTVPNMGTEHHPQYAMAVHAIWLPIPSRHGDAVH